MVNHAGLGSIVAALSFGLPMVCIPLDRDQPHNAERVEAVGAGIRLSPDAAASEIRTAIERVLEEPAYRTATEPFVKQYDPSAQAAIANLESLL
jgi:UDP:flavonoid glycosyltransferase YjiC (YdhE family)